MTVTVSLRQNQSTPLTFAQVDTNFQTLAAAANLVIPQGGNTASRPIAPVLYQTYIDTDLGQPIWCSQNTPSVIWINSAGVSV